MRAVIKCIYRAWAYLFARPSFSTLNILLHGLSLRGLGVLNYETKYLSGERDWLKRHLSSCRFPVVFDVGANVGGYSRDILSACPSAVIFAFEPHPRTFLSLSENISSGKVNTFNKAIGETNSSLFLYDYRGNDGSSHASVYREVIEGVHQAESIEHLIDVIALDDFCDEHEVEVIDLLKLDTEGNELNCLKGAQRMLASGRIRAIQFEFNEMNVVSGSRFKDFWDLLAQYQIYRLLPGGRLLKLEKYSPVLCEVYAYQNIVALLRNR